MRAWILRGRRTRLGVSISLIVLVWALSTTPGGAAPQTVSDGDPATPTRPGPTPTPATPPAADNGVLVTVNGTAITQAMVDAQWAQLPESVRQQLQKLGGVGRITDNLVAQELLYEQGGAAHLDQDPQVSIAIALARQQVIAQAQLHRTVDARMTDAALRAWYQDHLVQFVTPEVKISLASFADVASADAFLAKVRQGADFVTRMRKDGGTSPGPAGPIDPAWHGREDFPEPVASQLLSAEKGALVGPVSAARTFLVYRIDDHRDRTPSFEEARAAIKPQVERELQQAYIEELKAKAEIVRTEKEPAAVGPEVWTVPVDPILAGTEPSLGPAHAPITVLEYSDAQCPFCATATASLRSLVSSRTDLRLVYRDFPLDDACNEAMHRPMHKDACAAAVATRCAGDQGHYWDLLALLMQNQDELDGPGIRSMASQTGVDMGVFAACVQRPKALDAVRADAHTGVLLGVDGTPTLFVRGLYGDRWVQVPTVDLLAELLRRRDAGQALPAAVAPPPASEGAAQ